jgi:Sulfotransferase domain
VKKGMRHALYRLGFHDCYHMHNVRDNPEMDGPQWAKALDAKYGDTGTPAFTRKDWDRLLGESQGVCDVPAALFGVELAEAYPEAKVIILNRDPEQWYTSLRTSIHRPRSLMTRLKMLFSVLLDPETRAWAMFGRAMLRAFKFNAATEKDKALAWFDGMYREFREGIPEKRRMEFTVADGWGPLCEFLNVPIPMDRDENGKEVVAPFPRKNDTQYFAEQTNAWVARGVKNAVNNLYRLVGKTVLAGSTVYVGYLCYQSRLGGLL